jgi:membrane associated rhomboid family serine protease/Flp pilus assembly protein TadD
MEDPTPQEHPPSERPPSQRLLESRAKNEFVRRLEALTPRVWVTRAIVGLNALVFALMVASGVSLMDPTVPDLLAWGANFGPATTGGEWWRLLTAAFIHIGALHIALNMWCLWGAGDLAERIYGNAAFAVLYLQSAVGGSLVSLLVESGRASAGASGAVFGVYGALLSVLALNKGAIPPQVFRNLAKGTVGFVLFNVWFGLSLEGIDNAAHLGGLATGFVAGWCLRRPLDGRPLVRSRVWWGSGVTLALVVMAVGVGVRAASDPRMQSLRHHDRGLNAAQNEDWDHALEELTRAVELDPENTRAFGNRSWVLWSLDRRAEAVESLDAALALNPEDAWSLSQRGFYLVHLGRFEAALQDLDRAAELDSENENTHAARCWALCGQERYEEAVVAADLALAIDGELGWVRSNRGLALGRLGRFAEAAHELEHALEIDPDDASVLANLEWVRENL